MAHDVRSALNVGAMLRSAACFGVQEFVASGYTPYPRLTHDQRLPHVTERAQRQIAKTALGAEKLVSSQHIVDLSTYLETKRQDNYRIIALEQAAHNVPLTEVQLDQPTILIVGSEVDGLDAKILALADLTVEIPMPGRKESLNVGTAAGIALYQLKCV